jgi:fermentation-respiration switch protein FrsA (DUF1100 family)
MKFFATMSLAYLLLIASLYWFQRSLQYFPDAALVHPGDVGLDGFSTINLTAEDGTGLVAWYAPPAGRKPAIVYFQGNAQGIAARRERFKLFNDHGYGVLALGYRGYSGSQGSPSEHGLLQDGRAALAFLKHKGIAAARTVLYGESLGSGIATQLAAADDTQPGAVILEAPFTAATHVASRHYWYVPVSLLMKDQFRSIDHAPGIGAPVFVVHGDADSVVPFDHGKSLFAAITAPKEFLHIPGGGHIDDLTLHIWQRMEHFINKHLPH